MAVPDKQPYQAKASVLPVITGVERRLFYFWVINGDDYVQEITLPVKSCHQHDGIGG